jgi:hypothetical protein
MSRSSYPSCLHPYTKIQRDIGIGARSGAEKDGVRMGLMETRTIHSMVYNAMKLFMEINPQLFDDCSHEYTEMQSTQEQRQAARQSKWDQLAEQARRASTKKPKALASIPKGLKNAPPSRLDDDAMTQDSQKRLDALKLQDNEGGPPKDSNHVCIFFFFFFFFF